MQKTNAYLFVDFGTHISNFIGFFVALDNLQRYLKALRKKALRKVIREKTDEQVLLPRLLCAKIVSQFFHPF